MSKIKFEVNCGNAPRKRFLAELYTAIAYGDRPFLEENFPDDVSMEVVGVESVDSKNDVITLWMNDPIWKSKQLVLETFITHGKHASAHGMSIGHNSAYRFCDVYQFKGAGGNLIRSIVRFLIKA